MSEIKLNGRLCSAASFVRQRAVLADIGTDHAYLPIFLAERRIIERAVASDINEGPLKKAEENIKSSGLSDKIECTLTNGAKALAGRGITDYTVCGMGGELIAEIVECADHLKDKNIRLILQPMSKQAHLRKYLQEAGFSIIAEAYSSDAGKDYLCLACEFSGERREISDMDAELPTKGVPLSGRESMKRYYLSKLNSFARAAEGKKKGFEDASDELSLIEKIKELIALVEKECADSFTIKN